MQQENISGNSLQQLRYSANIVNALLKLPRDKALKITGVGNHSSLCESIKSYARTHRIRGVRARKRGNAFYVYLGGLKAKYKRSGRYVDKPSIMDRLLGK